MDNLSGELTTLVQVFIHFGTSLLLLIRNIELWLRGQLTSLGVDPQIQVVLLVFAAIFMLLVAVRLFGGLIRVVLVVFVLLAVIQIVHPLGAP